jgi:hypothetical protein
MNEDEQLVIRLIEALNRFDQRFVVNSKGPIEAAERLGWVIGSIAFRFSAANSLYPGFVERLTKAENALRGY